MICSTLLTYPTRRRYRIEKRKGVGVNKYSGGCASVTRRQLTRFKSMTQATAPAWKHNWRQAPGNRPTDAKLFHSYVEQAYELLSEYSSADFLYHDVREVCQPQYLFSVVSDMSECKLSMKIHNTESGLRVITIHKV